MITCSEQIQLKEKIAFFAIPPDGVSGPGLRVESDTDVTQNGPGNT